MFLKKLMCILLLRSFCLSAQDDCAQCMKDGEDVCAVSESVLGGSANELAKNKNAYENCLMTLFQTKKTDLNNKDHACQKCMIKHYALNTLEWVRAKMHEDHKKAAMSLVAAGVAVGTVGVLSSAASGTVTSNQTNFDKTDVYLGGRGEGVVAARSYERSSTTTTVSHIGLIAALGGGPATLIPTLAIGGSALAVYAGFKLTKEALDRKKCNVSCGFDQLRFSVRNARFRSEAQGIEKARKEHNEQLVEIAAKHLSNSVELFHEERSKEVAEGDENLQSLLRTYYGDHYEQDTSSQINYLISLFSGAVDKNVHNAIGTAGKCLLKCPVDLTWKFTCRVIDKLTSMEEVLRLAQMMSYSQNNMISFNTTRTTNLAKFLWMTRSNKAQRQSFYKSISLKYDAGRYGVAEKNLCSGLQLKGAKDGALSRADKMHALINFQLQIEKVAREHRGEIFSEQQKAK